MRRLKALIPGSLVFLFLSGFAAAQETSLARMPSGEQFSPADGSFTIALPKEPSEIKTFATSVDELGKGTQLTWLLSEGIVIIRSGEPTNAFPVTDEDYKQFFAGFKQSLIDDSHVKLRSETPSKAGDYRVMSYAMEYGGRNAQNRVFVGRRSIFLLIAIATDVPNAEALLTKALDSFTIRKPASQ